MASRILMSPFTHRLPLIAGLGISTAVLFPSLLSPYRTRSLHYLDSAVSASSPKDWSFSQYTNEARTPVVKQNGKMNPRAIRQISAGSILGMWNVMVPRCIGLVDIDQHRRCNRWTGCRCFFETARATHWSFGSWTPGTYCVEHVLSLFMAD